MADRPVIKIQPSKSKKKERTPQQAAQRAAAIAAARRKIELPRTLAKEKAQREKTAASEFKQYHGQINDIYQSFAGRNATTAEAQKIFRAGISSVGLMKALAKRPAFYKSPIYQSKSLGYIGIAKKIGMPVSRRLVADAIANAWDDGSFAEKLRQQPQYLNSNEFKSNEAAIGNVHRSIFGGDPDANDQLMIRESALGGWTPDQYAAALREDPRYYNSNEFKNKAYSAAAKMGFLPVASTVRAPNRPGVVRAKRPNSPRIPGDPNGY